MTELTLDAIVTGIRIRRDLHALPLEQVLVNYEVEHAEAHSLPTHGVGTPGADAYSLEYVAPLASFPAATADLASSHRPRGAARRWLLGVRQYEAVEPGALAGLAAPVASIVGAGHSPGVPPGPAARERRRR